MSYSNEKSSLTHDGQLNRIIKKMLCYLIDYLDLHMCETDKYTSQLMIRVAEYSNYYQVLSNVFIHERFIDAVVDENEMLNFIHIYKDRFYQLLKVWVEDDPCFKNYKRERIILFNRGVFFTVQNNEYLHEIVHTLGEKHCIYPDDVFDWESGIRSVSFEGQLELRTIPFKITESYIRASHYISDDELVNVLKTIITMSTPIINDLAAIIIEYLNFEIESKKYHKFLKMKK